MRAGFGLLRLNPQAFWSMTPRELAAALGPALPARDAPSREALDALMRNFPDQAFPAKVGTGFASGNARKTGSLK
ncbi:MAG: phage tail assembly chaperone [Rhizobiales bacterium]|nr:phage tail assembly chaperone [Hyphomicrobiales bacterium]OJY06359.1 MAG: hypothetical protein BGP07_14765 [Rhizobiales bacterium 63-22]